MVKVLHRACGLVHRGALLGTAEESIGVERDGLLKVNEFMSSTAPLSRFILSQHHVLIKNARNQHYGGQTDPSRNN